MVVNSSKIYPVDFMEEDKRAVKNFKAFLLTTKKEMEKYSCTELFSEDETWKEVMDIQDIEILAAEVEKWVEMVCGCDECFIQ